MDRYQKNAGQEYVEPSKGKCFCGEELKLQDDGYDTFRCPNCGKKYTLFGLTVMTSEQRYERKLKVLRNARDRGNTAAGFVGLVENIVDGTDGHHFYIAEEVKMALRAYKEVVGE